MKFGQGGGRGSKKTPKIRTSFMDAPKRLYTNGESNHLQRIPYSSHYFSQQNLVTLEKVAAFLSSMKIALFMHFDNNASYA